MFKEDTNKGGQDTIIAQGVKVEGNFKSHGNIIVEGEVHGSIRTERNLVIGEQARIVASVQAENAKVSGEVQGNIKAAEKLELLPTSRVTGDVQAKIISIASGAILNGKCVMPGGPESVREVAPMKKKDSRVKGLAVEVEETQAS